MEIEFEVRGDPKAQKRHRHARRGEYVKVYDPSSDDKQDFILLCRQYAPAVPLEGPLQIKLWFCFGRPKNHFGKKGLKTSAPLYHTTKPDVDNLIKLVLDSMKGVFWRDDTQVCSCSALKIYDPIPRVGVMLRTIDEPSQSSSTLEQSRSGARTARVR